VNIVTNCLDRHVATWRRNKLALIWEGEMVRCAPSPTTRSAAKYANSPTSCAAWA
jgi:acyl-coenzyme A synthetase/AMP-(fatty) acid ligase